MHGAAGGVGTATHPGRPGMGARTIAVVSHRGEGRGRPSAPGPTSRAGRRLQDAVKELTDGRRRRRGGRRRRRRRRSPTRCARSPPQGRLLVVGFAAGQGIPEVKVNRLLLNNIDVRGVGWGAFAMTRPGYMQEQWEALLPMMESGAVKPPIGATTTSTSSARRSSTWTSAGTLGKSVLGSGDLQRTPCAGGVVVLLRRRVDLARACAAKLMLQAPLWWSCRTCPPAVDLRALHGLRRRRRP